MGCASTQFWRHIQSTINFSRLLYVYLKELEEFILLWNVTFWFLEFCSVHLRRCLPVCCITFVIYISWLIRPNCLFNFSNCERQKTEEQKKNCWWPYCHRLVWPHWFFDHWSSAVLQIPTCITWATIEKNRPNLVVGLPSFFYCSCYLFSLCWPLTFPVYAAAVRHVSPLHSWRFLSPGPLISWVPPSSLLVTMHEMFSCVYSRLLASLLPCWKWSRMCRLLALQSCKIKCCDDKYFYLTQKMKKKTWFLIL